LSAPAGSTDLPAPDLARRRSLLTTALAAALLDTRGRPEPPEVTIVKRWLDNWTGLGHVITGMARQGFRLHLTNVEPGVWRATFTGAPMFGAEGRSLSTRMRQPGHEFSE
jgi:hypothetical protein